VIASALACLFVAGTAAPEASPPPAEVPLLLDVAGGISPTAGWPVTTGVPFADGRLHDTDRLRVEAQDGTPVPAQFQVRGRYPRSGDVRCLGVDFQLQPGAQAYRLVLDAEAGPHHPQPVRIAHTFTWIGAADELTIEDLALGQAPELPEWPPALVKPLDGPAADLVFRRRDG